MIVAIDFGITNTDIAVSNGGALDFFSFKTNLPICLLYTSDAADE